MPKQQVTIPVFIPHMGCPHRCVFCDQRSATSVRKLPEPDAIDKQIAEFIPHINKSVRRIELAFFGGSFTGIDRNTQEAFLGKAFHHLARNAIQGIRLSTRPDYIDDDALVLLKRYGVTTVELGVQSFNDRVLEASNRGHTAADVYAAARCLKKHGIDFVIQLMPGLPGDTRESCMESASAALSLSPSAVRIYPTVVMKGTALERMYREGRYAPLSLEEAVELCKDMLVLFRSGLVPVIRMGIHPLAPGEEANIAAGPYHPSFGYLVKSRARRDEMAMCMKRHMDGCPGLPGRVTVRIPATFTEEYLGAHRENIVFLKNAFNIARVDFTIEDIPAVLIA